MTVMNRELPYVNAFGTADISSATSVGEALVIAGLDWEVESRDLIDSCGNPLSGFKVNTRADNDAHLGIVSSSYSIIQNEEAFDFVNDLVDEGFEFDRAGAFRGGKSMWVMGKLPQSQILGDDISNNIIFINSHDGSSGVKVIMTPIRIICNNMLNYATKEADRIWCARHTKRLYSRMEEARYTLKLANSYMASLEHEADILANKKISDVQVEAIFDSIFPVDKNNDTERKINNISLLKENLFACMNEADIAQFRGTAWGVANAVSDLVSHQTPRRMTETAYESQWNKLINGHETMDKFYSALNR